MLSVLQYENIDFRKNILYSMFKFIKVLSYTFLFFSIYPHNYFGGQTGQIVLLSLFCKWDNNSVLMEEIEGREQVFEKHRLMFEP